MEGVVGFWQTLPMITGQDEFKSFTKITIQQTFMSLARCIKKKIEPTHT